MHKNNKGFSLIELIVVIAILAVMVGFLTLSLRTLLGTEAMECADKVSAKISSVKTGSMSMFNETMELGYHEKGGDYPSDGFYTTCRVQTIDKNASLVDATTPEIRKVGSKKVVIKATYSDGSQQQISGTECLVVKFKRSTGAFDYVGYKANHTDADAVYVTNLAGDPMHLVKLSFTCGGRTYSIDMVPETGKHTVKRD